MNPEDPLANLHPLRDPALISWWPPAPGWWLLGALATGCLLALAWWLLRRHRANAYRRRAQARLQQLWQQYLADNDGRGYLEQTNALLKSVALRAYPRQAVAPSSGRQWLDFLNSSSSSSQKFPDELVDSAYRRETPGLDLAQLHRAAQSWVKSHEAAP